MALLFMDGFDHYTTGDTAYLKWDAGVNWPYFTSGRLSAGGVRLPLNSNMGWFKKVDLNSVVVGAALYPCGALTAYSANYPIFGFKYDVVLDSNSHCRINCNENGAILAYNGDGTLLGQSSNGVISPFRWQYIECKVLISNSVGTVEVRVNENVVLNLIDKDTRNHATETNIKCIRFSGCMSNVGDSNYGDDFYMDSNTFHGDIRVRVLMPDANGNENDFTPQGAANNYQCVDETDINADTDYVYNNTVGSRDLYSMAAAPTLDQVKAIAINNCVRKDDAGTRTIKNLCRSGGNNYLETNAFTLDTNYWEHQSILELDPQDSQAWTKAKIDAAEFGLEITA